MHGVRFEKAIDIFDDPLGVTFADPSHAADEDREITIGTTFFNEVLVVSHTTRGGEYGSSAPGTRREPNVAHS